MRGPSSHEVLHVRGNLGQGPFRDGGHLPRLDHQPGPTCEPGDASLPRPCCVVHQQDPGHDHRAGGASGRGTGPAVRRPEGLSHPRLGREERSRTKSELRERLRVLASKRKPTTEGVGFIEGNWSGSGDLNPGPHALDSLPRNPSAASMNSRAHSHTRFAWSPDTWASSP